MKRFLLLLILSLTTSISFAGDKNQSIQYINTQQAAEVLGAYSQGVLVDLQKGKLVFVSGQIAAVPHSKQLLEGDIETATRQTFNNIQTILKAAGSDLNHVLRVDVFLKDFNDWDGMNKEYSKHFAPGHFPARQSIQSNIENRVEISCIAFVPNKM